MRKIIVGARVSMDGVMQEPMGPSEGFKLGGWARPYQDQDCWEEFDRLYFSEKLDLLLGRKTYQIFAGYWRYQVWEDAPNGGIPKLFKEIKKYVVSRSVDVDTSWQGSVLLRDIADVKRIFTFPVVLGGGKKLFADGSAPHAYQLTRSRVSGTGVMIGHYERDGEIKIGDAAPN